MSSFPVSSRESWVGHEDRTVRQQGWAGLKNGELLRRAADANFEVFLTSDQNLEYQQNLARSPLGVVVLVGPSTALEDLLPLVPSLLVVLADARRGHVVRVTK